MLLIHLPDGVAEALGKVDRFGLSLEEMVRDALIEALAELDDMEFFDEAMERIKAEPGISLPELRCQLVNKRHARNVF